MGAVDKDWERKQKIWGSLCNGWVCNNRFMFESLDVFHPLIARWFADSVGKPTGAQVAAWPVISRGEHVLVTAPTGSGKTLTAFLWALNQLITGAWPRGALRVLYVSPLKALNNDIRRNLTIPLEALRSLFEAEGEPFPDIRMAVRSGDTDPTERQRILRRPPEILITTPESLNLMLSSRKALPVLTGLRTVILDEIHAVAGAKRGTHLITAVDRLVRLSGEFQRIALSATVTPVETVAQFVGGYELHGEGAAARYEKRLVRIVCAATTKTYAVEVRLPDAPEEGPTKAGAAPVFPRIVRELKEIVRRNRSTLIFTNNRRHCERLAMLLNQDEPEMLAYSHHGSLSREMRTVVEQRLKAGELKAIVATSSLELGIDIGALDEVVLVQTPFSAASALQRIGRAGHQVGAVSRGTIYPIHGRDVVDAAVIARAAIDGDIEDTKPISGALDVLAQVIVSMTGMERWKRDDLYDHVRTSWPYRDLSRVQFDLVVNMLAGRYEDSRLRALQPLVSVDRVDGTIAGKDAALRILYSSGGTIPDRGYFTMRHATTLAKIGELDEEFVWERTVGDVFAMSLQTWRIRDITHNDVLVEQENLREAFIPFWRAEDVDRGFRASCRIGEFLEKAEHELDAPGFPAMLRRDHCLSEAAADGLVEFLERQRSVTATPLPHRHHVLVEYAADVESGSEFLRVILHTLWGGSVNRPFAYALAQSWEEAHGQHLEVFPGNDCILIVLPANSPSFAPFDLVTSERVEALLRARLEQTGYFGARFRENAARALLLPRPSFKKRMPLWMTRQRSKRLLEAAEQYEDFPILVETWRTCLRDEFDLNSLRVALDEIRTGVIRCSQADTVSPSPFAENSVWRLTSLYMYADDTPSQGGASKLSNDVLKEAVFSRDLRPRVSRELARTFQQKAQRIFPGYAPRTPEELLDWVKERLLIPEREWVELTAAAARDAGLSAGMLAAPIATKLARLLFQGAAETVVVPVETIPRLSRALAITWTGACLDGTRIPSAFAATESEDDSEERDYLAELLGEWLRFFGPVEKEVLLETFPVAASRLEDALESLEQSETIVVDTLTEAAESIEVCDSENLEILLRLGRIAARPAVKTRPLAELPLFLATQQGVARQARNTGDLPRAIESLIGLPVNAALLESDLLPARAAHYTSAMLDGLTSDSDLMWSGCEGQKVLVSFRFNRDLFPSPLTETEATALWDQIAPRLFPEMRGQYDFETLLEYTGITTAELTQSLWEFVWQGRVTNDSFGALRKGIETKFKPIETAGRSAMPSRAGMRGRFNAWKSSRAYPGYWYAVPNLANDADALDEEELNKERVRVLLDRYGVLFRELLAQELPCMRWGALFRTLRRMELSGELLTGFFFEDIPGLQFMSPASLEAFQRPLLEDAVYWFCATDPVSLCGTELPGMKEGLPRRLATTHLVYQGTRLVLISKGNGKELDIRVPPDASGLQDCFGFMEHLLTRSFLPLPSLAVNTINGERAANSPYLARLESQFELAADWNKVTVYKRA
ncbi:MAG: DEAD/DEAH box helicase [Candidatus Hydrogenedentales bacterium]|jgi:ATP-dependent Lhr-like helicase